MYLYLDTTFGTSIGLLKPDFFWLDFIENDGQKNASTLHSSIDQLCIKNNIDINQIEGLIQVAGPGGYTGLRVSDGISQTFSWFGYSTFSFYHFEVLGFLGLTEGLWLSNAFKGELFGFDQASKKQWLLKESDWFSKKSPQQLYTHYFSAFSPTSKSRLENSQFIETSELIKANPQSIFKQIILEKRQRELFYYRPIDQEFTKPTSPKF